jgi:hydroxymethylglutaryl-CoA reductase (NADPH)
MATPSERARQLLQKLNGIKSFDQILRDLYGDDEVDGLSIPHPVSWSKEAQEDRLAFIQKNTGHTLPHLSGEQSWDDVESLRGNIENYIGMTQIPTGVIGPLRIQGTVADGDFFVPLATSEGALIASYNRGAKATRMSGGIISVCLTESVQRAPLFKFKDLPEVGKFLEWILTQSETFKEIVSKQSRYAVLQDFRVNMEGNQVIIIFDYNTGNAAGQNMVTICTDAICQYILEHTPIAPAVWYIESNYSGDKKATAMSFTSVRGKKVTSEAIIKAEVVEKMLHATPQQIASYWQSSTVCTIESGTIGAQGHAANALTALFMACGQDVACIAEAYVGITRMEVNSDGDLYVSVTLPSLVVGTVGGGTSLPTQRECLALLECTGENSARKFAEICGATVLCGELSIAAAIAAGDFTKAHRIFGRKSH